MTGPVLWALLGHWRRNPLQLFTVLAGLALATALWSGVQAINAEARASYRMAADMLGAADRAQITTHAGGRVSVADYVALRRGGWRVTPVIEGRYDDIRILGIDPLTALFGGSGLSEFTRADFGAFLTAPGLILGQAEVLERLRGKSLADFETRPSMAPNMALMDIAVAQELLEFDAGLTRLMVDPQQPLGQVPLGQIAPHLQLTTPQVGADLARLTGSFHLNLTAFGLLAFAVGIFVVHGAIGLAFEQRRGMIRTLRALGVPLRQLVVVQTLELLCLALVAGTVGMCGGYLMAAALLPDVAATLRGLYGADVSGSLHLRPAWWLSGFAIALLGTGLAAAAGLWQVLRMPLLAAAQSRAWALASRWAARWQAGAALALLALAAILAGFGTGLMAGFALLAALLVGAALALPLLLDQTLAVLGGRAKTATAGWFWADTRQQVPGLSLALMALLLAMAANIGVSTMVSSFRQTFVGFLDQRLAAELYVSAQNPGQAADLQRFLEARVDSVLPVQSVSRQLMGMPVAIYGNRPHATYRDNWQFLQAVPDVWQKIAEGKALIVNEQFFRRAGLQLGQELAIGPDHKRTNSLQIAGVYGDYGNPVGQVVIAERLFKQLYPEVVGQRFGLRLDPSQVSKLRLDLIERFDLPQRNVIDQAQIKALSLAVFERTFTVTAALNVLTLAVAGFAILMSLLTLAGLRLPQLAPVWALGMTRASLAKFEVLRAVILAAFTSLMALGLGLLLAWVLLAVINVEAFGWRLPMDVFPAQYARLGALALLAALLAALWPAWRLVRRSPADLLQVFSNER
ncbi:MAG: ABC transporter permease [Rhodobacteraceae bacterium]|nr:ABC transporter permease [Paracoccaceae bacterium]